jgi:cytochrome c oxidase assembly protein Cox11
MLQLPCSVCHDFQVYPGETALAFYTAKNPTDVPITGISTYNVIPFEAGQYFNKIQVCSCSVFAPLSVILLWLTQEDLDQLVQ